MTKFQIPEAFLPGFMELSKLSPEDAEKIGILLNQIPVGATIQDFRETFTEAGLPENIQVTAETVFSMGALLAGETENDLTELATGLSKAFQEKNQGKITNEEAQQLKRNLLIILKNGDNLKKTYKAYQLFSENARIYRNSRVMTDIRLLFNDELDSNPRSGLILHQLKIEYVENEKPKSFFVSLDREDLVSLSENFQRALKKEESIKQNQDTINFLTLK
ncbi:MAG: hypothetical protein ACOCUL_00140 [Bacteroidota bacterium]